MTERWDRLVPPVVAPTAHLGEDQIAAVEPSDVAAKHLADCAWCQTRRAAVSDDERDELAALLHELDAAPAAEDALKVAGSFAVPTVLAQLLDVDATAMPSVAPAQLWRMVWNGHDALGVVVEKNSWWVTVAPLTTDQDLADEYTALCDADATSLSYPTAVFMRAATTVPKYTLAQFLGDVRPLGVADPTAELQRLQRACLQGTEPPDAMPTGRPLQVDDWDRQEALDGLVELMSWFESATSDVLDETGEIVGGERENADTAAGADDGTRAEGGRHRGDAGRSGEPVDVVDALKSSNMKLGDLAAATGLDPARLLDFLQGGGKPNQPERDALGRALNVQVRGSYPDVARLALLEVVSEPEYRSLWRESALDDETDMRGSSRWTPDDRHHDRVSHLSEARHASTASVGESLRPFMEQMLTQNVAARSVHEASRGDDGSLDVWRDIWRDRLAHRRR